jgi:hypothetical protein
MRTLPAFTASKRFILGLVAIGVVDEGDGVCGNAGGGRPRAHIVVNLEAAGVRRREVAKDQLGREVRCAWASHSRASRHPGLQFAPTANPEVSEQKPKMLSSPNGSQNMEGRLLRRSRNGSAAPDLLVKRECPCCSG